MGSEKSTIVYDHSVGKNLPQLLRNRSIECSDIVLQYVKKGDGTYEAYSYSRVYRKVLELASALKKFGIKKGDFIGIIADNRREWMIMDMALLSLGAVDIPRGCDSMGPEIRFILQYSDCRIAVFENSKQLAKVLEKIDEVPLLKDVIMFDALDEATKAEAEKCGLRVHSYVDFENEGSKMTEAEKNDIEKSIDSVEPQDIATIIFTSGTTGTPKGVMLTHDNYIAQCEVVQNILTYAKPGDLWLSVLPIWHSFERAVLYLMIALKNGCAYSRPSAQVLLADMAAVKPRTMCGVPRLWESLAHGVQRAMKKKGGITYFIFNLAMTVGTQYNWAKDRVLGLVCRYRKVNRLPQQILCVVPLICLAPLNALFDLLVFKKIRSRLGGNLCASISGGGSLQPDVDSFYKAIGIKMLEGYGMSESAPVLSVRHPERPRFGCVGEIYPSAEIKIVEHDNGTPLSSKPLPPGTPGLILVHGRQVMKGYYKQQELTSKVVDADGWLNTGDLGVMTYDNEIKIIGRAKDTIVLLGGENIEPLVIEKALMSSQYIETAVIVGQDQKYIGALLVPVKDAIISYAEENHILYASYEELLHTNEIQKLIRDEIDHYVCPAQGFRTCERVYKFALLPDSFEVGKEMSAKMEVMRFKVAKLYDTQIKSLF